MKTAHNESSIQQKKDTPTDKHVLQFANGQDNWSFSCSAKNGGRITSFQLNNLEILVPPNDSGMFGSTFWTAPENWGWPPPTAVDNDTYSVKTNDAENSLFLESPIESKLQVKVTKKYRANLHTNSIDIEYGIQNVSHQPQSFAPWEISRVAKGGLTFYRQGSAKTSGENRGTMPTSSSQNNVIWYSHPTDMKDDAKLFDSSADGWIAHTNQRLLLVKQFEPATPIAPGEGEIEIYACPGYVEVEQQGSYLSLAPKQSLAWNVRWYLREIPSGMDCTPHSQELLRLVDSLLAMS